MTEFEQQVAAYLERRADEGVTEISTSQVFMDALGIDPSADVERAGRLARQLAEAMHQAGWRRIGRVGRGRDRKTLYRLPERLTR